MVKTYNIKENANDVNKVRQALERLDTLSEAVDLLTADKQTTVSMTFTPSENERELSLQLSALFHHSLIKDLLRREMQREIEHIQGRSKELTNKMAQMGVEINIKRSEEYHG